MISTGQVTGKWKNSKATTQGISNFELVDNEGNLSLTVHGVEGGFLPSIIGPLAADPHGKDTSSTDCIAFQASTTVNGMNYFFAGNVNKGLIIIATYVKGETNTNGNFFVREFFYKLK